MIVGNEGSLGVLTCSVVVPDGVGQGKNAVNDGDSTPFPDAASVSLQVKLSLEGLVGRLDYLAQRLAERAFALIVGTKWPSRDTRPSVRELAGISVGRVQCRMAFTQLCDIPLTRVIEHQDVRVPGGRVPVSRRPPIEGRSMKKQGSGHSGCHRANPFVRAHPECLTGDVFGSTRCGLQPAVRRGGPPHSQSWRCSALPAPGWPGTGLYNKLDAYDLQDQELHPCEASRALGLGDAPRDHTAAARMLIAAGHTKIDLLTNSPYKVRQPRRPGIAVGTVLPTGVFLTRQNMSYLRAKAAMTAHTISQRNGQRD